MPESSLKPHRDRIDHIDKAILDLLKERNEVVKEVLITKIAHKLPIFVAGREDRRRVAKDGSLLIEYAQVPLNGRHTIPYLS